MWTFWVSPPVPRDCTLPVRSHSINPRCRPHSPPARVIIANPHPAGSTSSSAVMITPTEAASRRSLIGVLAVVFFQSR